MVVGGIGVCVCACACVCVSVHGPIELFLVPASTPHLVYQSIAILFVVYIKDPLMLIEKNSPHSGSIRFLL